MDREAREVYLVVVQVKDMLGLDGGYSATTTVTISLMDVNDNGPTFQHSEKPKHDLTLTLSHNLWERQDLLYPLNMALSHHILLYYISVKGLRFS